MLHNLGEGVLTQDIYDPAISPLYRDALKALQRRGAALPRRRFPVTKLVAAAPTFDHSINC